MQPVINCVNLVLDRRNAGRVIMVAMLVTALGPPLVDAVAVKYSTLAGSVRDSKLGEVYNDPFKRHWKESGPFRSSWALRVARRVNGHRDVRIARGVCLGGRIT